LSFTSAYPANRPKLSAFIPNYVFSYDSAEGVDEVSVLYREFQDVGAGVEESSVPYKLIVGPGDEAAGADLAVGVGIPVLDAGETIELPYDRSLELVELGGGIETRLSPVPVATDDASAGYDAVSRKDMRFMRDASEGFEASRLSIPARDAGAGSDVLLAVERIQQDAGAGAEVTLSPVPITLSDAGVGSEVTYFPYWEPVARDYGEGREYSALATLVAAADTSSGTDVCAVGKVVADRGDGYEASSPERVLVDVGEGLEVRLSPVPLLAVDAGAGVEVGFFTYRELVGLDLASGVDRLLERRVASGDSALGGEEYSLVIPVGDSAVGLSVVRERALEALEYGEGAEVRLSPVPVTGADVGAGVEVIVFRDFSRSDDGRGVDDRLLHMVEPPLRWALRSTSASSAWAGRASTSAKAAVTGELRGLLGSGAVAVYGRVDSVEARALLEVPSVLSAFTYAPTVAIEAYKAVEPLSGGVARWELSQSLSRERSLATQPLAKADLAFAEGVGEDVGLERSAGVLRAFTEHVEVYGLDRLAVETGRATVVPPLLQGVVGELVASLQEGPAGRVVSRGLVLNYSLSTPLDAGRVSATVVRQLLHLQSLASTLRDNIVLLQAPGQKVLLSVATPLEERRRIPVALPGHAVMARYSGFEEAGRVTASSAVERVYSAGARLDAVGGAAVLRVFEEVLVALLHRTRLGGRAAPFLDALRKAILRIREVREGDFVLASDINVFIDVAAMFIQALEVIAEELGREDLVGGIVELKGIAVRLARVRALEVVDESHHNAIVEFIEELYKVVSRL